MTSNPIQQRIELLGDQWDTWKSKGKNTIVRMQCNTGEVEMIDTFYSWMIAVDTPVEDIAFHFDMPFTTIEHFSAELIDELNETIEIWNNSVKDERIDFVQVDWKPDFTLYEKKNPAALFVNNFNRLAQVLNLPVNIYTVAIIKTRLQIKYFTKWLEYAVEAGISPKVKFLVDDTYTNPVFEILAKNNTISLITIPVNLDMPKALEQIAAMGDPDDPATAYRSSFMKMMNAMEAGKETEAEKCGKICIKIAEEHLAKDPYWVMQIVVIFIALGNDKMRYKKKDEQLGYATKAVETARAGMQYFSNDVAIVLVAQALMFRATIYFTTKQYQQAFNDYEPAFNIYAKQGNIQLAIEAARMAAKSADKCSNNNNGVIILAEAAKLGKYLDPDTARASTFAGIIELLVQTKFEKYISADEVKQTCISLYGKNWIDVVRNWKKAPDTEAIRLKETELIHQDKL